MAAPNFPFNLTNGPTQIIDADEIMANLQAAVSPFNAAIVDAMCSALMDLDGNKLSPSPAKQVPESRLGLNSVSQRVLQKDATSPGSDASRAVTGDHIGTLTVAQVLRILPALSIAKAMLQAGSVTLDKIGVTMDVSTTFNSGTIANGARASVAVTLGATYPKATYELLTVYTKNVLASAGVTTACWAVPSPSDSGTNWAMGVTAGNDSGVSAIVTGKVISLFITRS